jgi:hypothetical protein
MIHLYYREIVDPTKDVVKPWTPLAVPTQELAISFINNIDEMYPGKYEYRRMTHDPHTRARVLFAITIDLPQTDAGFEADNEAPGGTCDGGWSLIASGAVSPLTTVLADLEDAGTICEWSLEDVEEMEWDE